MNKVKELINNGSIDKDKFIESFDYVYEANRKQCKFWSSKGPEGKAKLRFYQEMHRKLDEIIQLSLK